MQKQASSQEGQQHQPVGDQSSNQSSNNYPQNNLHMNPNDYYAHCMQYHHQLPYQFHQNHHYHNPYSYPNPYAAMYQGNQNGTQNPQSFQNKTQTGQGCRGRGHGRGYGRGRGCGRGRGNRKNVNAQYEQMFTDEPKANQNSNSKPKYRQKTQGDTQGYKQGYKQGDKPKNRRKSSSSSRSSHSRSHSKKKRHHQYNNQTQQLISQVEQLSLDDKKHYAQLQLFIQERNVNQRQRFKIVTYLQKKLGRQAPSRIPQILGIIDQLDQMELTSSFPLPKIVKIICKRDFIIEDIVDKLKREMHYQSKKQPAYQMYLKAVADLDIKEEVPFVSEQDLMEVDHKNTLFLVDGNNVFNTHKVFREYFRSQERLDKIQAQIRLRWLISHSLDSQNVILFFDQLYKEEEYAQIVQELKIEPALLNKIQVIYGDTVRADEKIVERMANLQQNKGIILVSADKILAARCSKLKPLKKTSGRFFIKYCKRQIKNRYQLKPEMKGIIKRIIS